MGTLLVAHGASAEWNAQVEQLAAQAQLTGPLEICYIMGPGAASHLFQDAVARLVAKGVIEDRGGAAPGIELQRALRAGAVAGG